MRALTESAGSRSGHHARFLIRSVLDGSAATLLPHTLVEAWLLETSIAVIASERQAARHALKAALTLAEPLQAIRPFVQTRPEVLALLEHEHRSLGASDGFADRALTAGSGRVGQRAVLSERELVVLGLLASMLSLGEIAADLTVSVNTVKSHVGAIFDKLGVRSRRLAVLTARERGLLSKQRPVTRVPGPATRSGQRLSRR
jgi:LuxR family maltose regulon positive regulatory protein